MDKDYVMQVADTARQQLLATTPMNVILSWGIDKFFATIYKEMPALMFKANGRLHKGNVIIAFNDLDYYEVYLQSPNKTQLVSDEVYFDELGELIDRHIEKGTDKKEYERFCEQEFIKLING